MLQSLGYIGVETARVEEWEGFSRQILGMQIGERTPDRLTLRTDERCQRLFVDAGNREGISCMGWEVRDAAALAVVAVRLERAGHPVTAGSAALAEERKVAALIVARDPIGNRIEFFHGAADAHQPFRPSRAISGFRTGPLGLGHAVLTARSVDSVIPFYRDVLGFKLSDYALRPFRAFFFHLNSRHHSFAVVETGHDGFHHLMVELNAFDDVGQAYDLAQQEEGRVGVTLGRHTNDYMTSFYARTPSDFMIEYGWGGRSIDPADWSPFECDYGPSLWGHERSWLSPEKRAEALQLRLAAAAAGYKAPDFVRPRDEAGAAVFA